MTKVAGAVPSIDAFAVLALSECVKYFSSDIYVLLIDCSEAFDNVTYVKLFGLLILQGFDCMTLRWLIHSYTNQHLNVFWNHNTSKYFL